ncbi:MAG: creatininase family protein [Candidatus Latescibacterota bacterium]
MTVLFHEMTREQIKRVAPRAIGVLPVAATEQHGPHLAVGTDTLVLTAVAERAARAAADQVPVVVTPTVPFGSSHHHYPFGATLSLSSSVLTGVVQDVLDGLVRCGFRRIAVLNGHGGNKDVIGMASQDLVHRMGRPATVASCNYWDLARPALLAANLMPADRIPGHAAHFETSVVMALRPDLVDEEALARTRDVTREGSGLDVPLTGAVVQTYGTWGKGPGHTDKPADASAELGHKLLAILVEAVARFFRDFGRAPGPVENAQ